MNFSSSKLVRLLGDPTVAGADGASADSAERLSQLLGVFDAVTLHGALQSLQTEPAPVGPAVPSARPGRGVGVAEQVQQVRAVLANGIRAKPAASADADAGAGRRRGRNPEPMPEAPEETGADYAPFRQRYLDQQRNMELMIDPLRAHVREAVSPVSPTLRQLAALDAVWEQMLGGREQKLLATVPALLKKRFEQLRKAHAEEDPARWRQPGGWLTMFGKEQQAVLLAELDVRLEPVTGLVEAFTKEVEKTQ